MNMNYPQSRCRCPQILTESGRKVFDWGKTWMWATHRTVKSISKMDYHPLRLNYYLLQKGHRMWLASLKKMTVSI